MGWSGNMNKAFDGVETPLPVHRAEELTHEGGQALITLGNQVYKLRITRAGKLILTK